jgi:DNA invertase Pin-like site-specific DNA recombinase
MRGGTGPRRVLGYARVSSPDQALGTSLQDQQNAIRAYAQTRGLAVDRFFVEAESAIYEKVERREQIRLLLTEVRAGDLILCDKLDRWSRDPEFTYRSVREILEAKASFFAVGDQCDPSTKEGDTMLGFRVLVAREEHKRIKERMVGTRKLLRDRGLYSEGLPPFGYRRSRPRGVRAADKNVLFAIPEDVAFVRDMFARCIRGESINDILRAVPKPRSLDKGRIGKILRNRIYIGEVKDSRGVWIRGQHEPMIAADVFARAQAALDGRRLGGARAQSTSRTSTWLLRQIGRCVCGAKLAAAYRTSVRSEDYLYYYFCGKRCGARYTRVEPVDAAVVVLVEDRLVKLRERLGQGTEPARAARVVDFAEEKAKLQRKRERFLEVYAEGDMTKEELRAALAKVDGTRGKVDVREAEQRRASPLATREMRRRTLEHVREIQRAWRKAPPEIRRKILHELATSVVVARDAAPIVAWKTPEAVAADFSV